MNHNHRWLLGGVSFLVMLAATVLLARANAPRFEDHWQKCHADADCVLVSDPCSWPDAINGRHIDAYRGWVRYIAPLIECALPESQPIVDPRCVERRCKAVPRKAEVN